MLPHVAIPSYKRSDTISCKTLRFLKESNYPANLITIFVASEKEYKLYKNAIDPLLYNELIIGELGLCAQRKFISQHYLEDQIIIQLDDDVKNIKSCLPFISLIELGYTYIASRQSGLFGVLPNDDGRRFKNAITTHLTHILGSFFMCRNHKDIIITHTEKEDFERSILYFKRYGKVIRYQNAGVCTSYGKGTGGLQANVNRSQNIAEEIKNIKDKYPEYIRLVIKKGNTTDIVLNWRSLGI